MDVLSLRQAILATLHYFDLFDFPLKAEELEKYLYGWQAPRAVIEDEIFYMPEVEHEHGYFFLAGRRDLTKMRKEKEELNKKLWKKVSRWSWLFALCPFVRMVAVCNSLSYGNVKKASDIDLFVVTAEGRLSTCRFFMKLFTQIFGIRAHGKKKAGRFCLSFFVSEKALCLEDVAHEFDPHLAYFVLTMKPIHEEKMARKFFSSNAAWLMKYFKRKLSPDLGRVIPTRHSVARSAERHCALAEPELAHVRRSWVASFFRRIAEAKLKLFRIFSEQWCENWLAKREHEYRKRFSRSPGVMIQKNIFKFHEKDPREEIAKRFLEAL